MYVDGHQNLYFWMFFLVLNLVPMNLQYTLACFIPMAVVCAQASIQALSDYYHRYCNVDYEEIQHLRPFSWTDSKLIREVVPSPLKNLPNLHRILYHPYLVTG